MRFDSRENAIPADRMPRLRLLAILALMIPAFVAWVESGEVEHPGTDEGARALLETFLQPETDLVALVEKLRPTSEDCKAVFVGEGAQRAEEVLATLPWDEFAKALRPKEERTELLLYSATTEDFRTRSKPEGFPAGYMRYVEFLKPGVAWYSWEFIKPGEGKGWPAEALTYVNGHWRLFPKAYRIADPSWKPPSRE